MKKFIVSLFIGLFAINLNALDVNEFVVIVNPNINPGTEVSEEVTIIFYDAQGRQINVGYTYNATTNTVTITNGTGVCYVVITNKKTHKTKTIHLMQIGS